MIRQRARLDKRRARAGTTTSWAWPTSSRRSASP